MSQSLTDIMNLALNEFLKGTFQANLLNLKPLPSSLQEKWLVYIKL